MEPTSRIPRRILAFKPAVVLLDIIDREAPRPTLDG
jgi:hypothetical protein